MSIKKFFLTWNAPGGEPTGYKAEYKKKSETNWTEHPIIFGSTSGFITGLDVCSFYDFRVFGLNVLGDGAKSLPATGIMGRLPGSPVALVGTSSYDQVSSSISISLSWETDNGGCDIQQTIVEHKLSTDQSYIQNIISNSSNSYSIIGLEGSKTYDIRLRAINVVGTGNYSNTLSVTTIAEPTVPGQVSNLNVQYIEHAPALLTVSRAGGYFSAITDTGYYMVVGLEQTNTVIANNNTTFLPSNLNEDIEISIYACNQQGDIVGNITRLSTWGVGLKAININNLKMLEYLYITDSSDSIQDIDINLNHLYLLRGLYLSLTNYNINSLRAAGVSLTSAYGHAISAQTISASSINRFFEDLANSTDVGTSISLSFVEITDSQNINNNIATSKGYFIL